MILRLGLTINLTDCLKGHTARKVENRCSRPWFPGDCSDLRVSPGPSHRNSPKKHTMSHVTVGSLSLVGHHRQLPPPSLYPTLQSIDSISLEPCVYGRGRQLARPHAPPGHLVSARPVRGPLLQTNVNLWTLYFDGFFFNQTFVLKDLGRS